MNIQRYECRPHNPEAIKFVGTMATDASLMAWGCNLLAPRLFGASPCPGLFYQTLMHINVRKMQAMLLALEIFSPTSSPCTFKRLKLWVDSQIVMYYLDSMTTCVAPLKVAHRIALMRHGKSKCNTLQPVHWVMFNTNNGSPQ